MNYYKMFEKTLEVCYYKYSIWYWEGNMEQVKEKKNILFRNLDLAFVYLFIFLVGIAIVLLMTTYLNNKVKEFTTDSLAITLSK